MNLAQRIKSYQAAYDHRIPQKSHAILQLDGNAFHTYTKGMVKPFDDRLIANMNATAIAVLERVSNAKFAYVQSDEINIYVTDMEKEETQPFYSNRVQKVGSIAAGIASATMSRLYPEKGLAVFDARFFSVPDMETVEDYFVWRQVDCIKNSVQSVGQTFISRSELHSKHTGQVKEMLAENGHPWESYPTECKQGRLIIKEASHKTISYTHKRTKEVNVINAMTKAWTVKPAPNFKEGLKFL